MSKKLFSIEVTSTISFLILLFIDQITKYVAFFYNVSTSGFLFLQVSENKGSAFSMFSNISWYGELIIVLSILLFFYGLYYLTIHRKKLTMGEWVAYTLFGAGLIGNLIDRILFDFVRDFIGMKYFAIFNIADIYLCLAVFLLLLLEFKKK